MRAPAPDYVPALDPVDRAIVNALQAGIPICDHPYAAAAAGLGLAEDELIARLLRLLEQGVLSRCGPLFNAERLGGGLTLAAMEVPPAAFDRVAAIVNARPEVAHNYAREHRLNMWFVIATENEAEIAAVVDDIERASGLPVFAMPKLDEYFIGLRFHA
jgi:DNA-binding Lrp family transcriptional regulator